MIKKENKRILRTTKDGSIKFEKDYEQLYAEIKVKTEEKETPKEEDKESQACQE